MRERRRAASAGRTPALSDESLLAGFALGAPDLTHAFVERFQSRIFGLANSLLRDHRLAEDVAQEAFVRAFRHADAFDPRRGSVATWLLRITRNLAIDNLRVKRPDPVEPDVLIGLMRAPVTDGEFDRVHDDSRAILADLPEEQARSLVLAAVYGYTAREISEIESIPLGTAKTRIRLGLEKARARVARESRESIASGESASIARIDLR